MRDRRAWQAPSLVVAAVVLLNAGVLVGGVFRFEDIAAYFEPLWAAARRAMLEGRMPLWEGGAWSGQPLLGDPQIGAFYPPNWLWMVLPVLRAYAVLAVAHMAWGGLGMYALARARGASAAASSLAGIALGVGGFMVLQVRHLMFVEATAWLPWLVLCGWRWLEEGEEGGQRLWVAGMAAATGMMLHTGGVSMIYYGAWFVAAVLGARLLALPSRALMLRRGAGLALGALLGVALAAPTLAPMLEHAPLSPRAQGTDYAFAASVSWPGWHYLPTLLLPNVLGQEALGDYAGAGTQWELAGFYCGLLTFLLALYAWLRGPRQRRGERIALGLVCVLAVLLAPGAHSPVHRALCHVMPLLSSMRCPARALYVFSLAVPLLAADGLDGLLAMRSPRQADRLGALAVAVVLFDLLFAHRRENPTTTLAAAQAASRPPAVAFLEAHRGDRYVNDVKAPHTLHNSGLLWNLENASGYSSLPLWRYLHYLWIANHGRVYPSALLRHDLAAQGLWRFSSPLVDGLNVRWLLTRRPPPDVDHYVRRFAGDDGLDVWENLHALPRAWVVHRARVVDGPEAAARAIAAADFNPHVEAILEGPPLEVAPDGSEGWEKIAGLETDSPLEVHYFVELARPGVLVMADPAHPGWSARVDGQPATLRTANYALRAVVLPAGRHAVEVRFSSTAVDRGLLVCGVAAVGLLGLMIRRRRRST